MLTLAKPEFIDGSIVSFQTFAKNIKKGVGLDGNIPSSNLSRAEQPPRHDLLIH